MDQAAVGQDDLVAGAAALGAGPEGLPICANDIRLAASCVGAQTTRTPVHTCSTLDGLVFGAAWPLRRLLFKCENFQRVGAFKFRGACNAVFGSATSVEELRKHGVVAHSSGNHGMALALAGRLRGVPVTIVMPDDAAATKVAAVRGYGATVVFVPASQRELRAAELVAAGAVLVHPSNEPLVMAGQGTLMLEFYQQALRLAGAPLDVVVVPVGGGGLLSGVAVAAKALRPALLVVAAEPALADDCARSMQSGRLEGHRGGVVPATVADGLKTTLGSNTWPVIHALVHPCVVTVSEEEIKAAMKLIFERMKLVVEPSSAVGLAAALTPVFRDRVLSEPGLPDDARIGIVLCGGNVALPLFI